MGTRGYKTYIYFVNTGEFPDSPCLWCRANTNGNPVGFPVGEPTIDIIENRVIIFYSIIDQYCSFECLQAEYNRSYRRTEEWNVLGEQIEFIFGITHPGKFLKPAKHWKFLKSNNGFMTYDQYRKGNHVFEETGEIIFIPAQCRYKLIKQ